MELVAAGPKHDIDLSAAIAPERSVVGAGQNLEFAHGIHGRCDRHAVQLRVAVVNAVKQEIVGILTAPIDVDGEGASYGSGGPLGGGYHAGDQEGEIVEIASV